LLLAQSFLKRDREIELSTVTDDEYESNKELLIKINNRFDDYCFNSFSELKKYLLEINKITLID
ncbi:hypothetical protein, partial [Pseudomonas oryzihabitans]|uniref:hypothetical protein n=1 Tax=Pseudomonas oryzihabitans TaxID=47885 RepID=UPI002B1E2C3F